MTVIADTPAPPYYAVIFTSLRNSNEDGYADMASRMVELASQQPGFLGIESAMEAIGITVSYWSSIESIKQWKSNMDHIEAQKLGRSVWYASYRVRISKVERDYGF